MKILHLTFFIVSAMLATRSFSEQLAFPTAEGSGRFAKGGRGGEIYEVTNLNNSGAGSIVDAVSKPNRTIVFRISGTIALNGVLLQPQSNITIAGQTAPGDGICIKGRILIGNVSDLIIRYIRVRVDAGGVNADGDAIDIAGGPDSRNIIIDHVTASFSRDEGISCRETNTNVTVQWCIISEALTLGGAHSFGSLIRGEFGAKKTYHHNLYAHNMGRNPRPGNYTSVTSDPEGLYLDFRNNVIFNWQDNKAGYNGDLTSNTMSRYNFIGNAYVRGPESTTASNKTEAFREGCAICIGHFKDNSYEGIVPADQWSLVGFPELTEAQVTAYKARSTPISMDPVITTSAAQAKIDVLAFAGASYPKRDIIDTRIVNDVVNKTGHFIAQITDQPEGAWPILNSLPAPKDDDHDGIPNDWESAHGLNPNNPIDRNNVGADGFTMLEEYLNGMINDQPAPVPNQFQQNGNRADEVLRILDRSSEFFTVKYSIDNSSVTELRVVDLKGHPVWVLNTGLNTRGMHEVRIPKAGMPSGILLLQLQYGHAVRTMNFVNGI